MSEFNPRLAHLGIFCKDLDAMIAFYTREFGMIVTDSGLGKSGKAATRRRGAFLSADPSEHHQLALIEGRDPETLPTTAQISFLVPTLGQLRSSGPMSCRPGSPCRSSRTTATRGASTSTTRTAT